MATIIRSSGIKEEVQPKNPKKGWTLEEMQKIVGGYVELLRLDDGREMYLNEDGKRLNLPRNEVADLLARKAGIAVDDFVVGDVLVCNRGEVK